MAQTKCPLASTLNGDIHMYAEIETAMRDAGWSQEDLNRQ